MYGRQLLPLCLASLCLQSAADTICSDSSMPTAVIAKGKIIGTTTSLPAATASTNKFLGIPFAKSPPQRFSPAEPADSFSGSLMAQTYSPACIQQFTYPQAVQTVATELFNTPPPPAGESEDCLYLNVFAPATPAPPGGRAVMFWIYGGAYQFGTGTLSAYDGSAFAAYHDVIVVTHNYRTNVFGFPGYSELPAAERNLGLLDQRLALQWVQENIHAFGGDLSKVTIFGESAGAFSVDALVTSFNTSNAPFRAAIMESGQVSFSPSPAANLTNDDSIQQLAQKLNCTSDTLTCLRAAPAATLKNIIEMNAIIFPPVIDNYTYVADRAAKRISGQIAQVPTLIGTNANENRLFALGQNNLTAYAESTFGSSDPDFVQKVLNAFPTNGSLSGYDQISIIGTLLTFQCGSAYLANATQHLNIPTWRYLYNATFPNFSPFNGLLRVFHSSEIIEVFQSYPGGPINPQYPTTNITLPLYLPPTAQQYALGRTMNAAWADFAKNPQLGPGWGQVGSYNGTDMSVFGGSDGLAAGVQMMNSSVIDAQCEIFKPLFEKYSNVTLS